MHNVNIDTCAPVKCKGSGFNKDAKSGDKVKAKLFTSFKDQKQR